MKRRRWIATGGVLILLLVFAGFYAARRQRSLGEFQFLAPYVTKDITVYSRGTAAAGPGALTGHNAGPFVATRSIHVAGRPTKELFQMVKTHFAGSKDFVYSELDTGAAEATLAMIEPFRSRPFGTAEPGLQSIEIFPMGPDSIEITTTEILSNPEAMLVRMTHPGHDPFIDATIFLQVGRYHYYYSMPLSKSVSGSARKP